MVSYLLSAAGEAGFEAFDSVLFVPVSEAFSDELSETTSEAEDS